MTASPMLNRLSFKPACGLRRAWSRLRGFTLIELMIAVAVIGILAAVAYPSYVSSVTKSHRGAAKGCLAQHVNFMERFYAANMSYYKDTSGAVIGGGAAASLPPLPCDTDGNLDANYSFSFKVAPTAASSNTYEVQAVPQGRQASLDAQCGTLILDQAGSRKITGTGGVSACW